MHIFHTELSAGRRVQSQGHNSLHKEGSVDVQRNVVQQF